MSVQSLANLTIAQLLRAIAIKKNIHDLEAELEAILEAPPAEPVVAKRRRKKRKSAGAKQKLVAAKTAGQVKRNEITATPAPKKARRKMSAQGRANHRAAAIARWAKVKAAAAKSDGA
jgi:hypothetical protein